MATDTLLDNDNNFGSDCVTTKSPGTHRGKSEQIYKCDRLDVLCENRNPGDQFSVGRSPLKFGNFFDARCRCVGIHIPREDVEYLTFAYSTKGDIKEYTIRVDIECVDLSEIPDGFKLENCVYPRACTTIENYTGNRYEYESKVNELAWRLTWMNYAVLGGKRGLIQRAVDSYRNRFQESRSRRVIRQDKINNGTLRKRSRYLVYAKHKSKSDDYQNPNEIHLEDLPGGNSSMSSNKEDTKGIDKADNMTEFQHTYVDAQKHEDGVLFPHSVCKFLEYVQFLSRGHPEGKICMCHHPGYPLTGRFYAFPMFLGTLHNPSSIPHSSISMEKHPIHRGALCRCRQTHLVSRDGG